MTDREAIRAEALEEAARECLDLIEVIGALPLSSVNAALRDAANRIRALARGNAGAVPEGWRPIDSAPKDGSWVLSAGGGAEFGMPVKWNIRVGAWECDACMLEDWDNQAEGYSRPTHWMPLPAAPVANGGEG